MSVSLLVLETNTLLFHIHREVVVDLIEEYRAAERADYVTYGSGGSGAAGSHAVASASNGATPQTTLPDSPMA